VRGRDGAPAIRGLWHRIDDVVWAVENDPASPGWYSGNGSASSGHRSRRAGRAREAVYGSVLQLVKERFDAAVTTAQQAQAIDADDIGGI